VGIWAAIQGLATAGRNLIGLLRLARELQKDTDARIAIGLERMLSNLDEQLKSAASDEEKAQIVAERRKVLIKQFEYEERRMARLAPIIMREWAPPGAVARDAAPLPEPERRALSAAATAAALQPARTFYDHLLAGNVLYAAGDHPKALEEYDAALKLRPDDPTTLSNRAATLNYLKRYEGALADCNRSLELRPDDPDTLNNRAGALIGLKRYQEALADCDRALELRPDHPTVLNNRGNALGYLQRYDEALADYNRALELRPDDPDTLNNRGITLGYLRHYEEALADFNRALELRPDDPKALYNIACLYSLWQRYDESLQWLEKAIAGDASYRAKAAEDEDFAALRADPQFGPRFQKLMAEGTP